MKKFIIILIIVLSLIFFLFRDTEKSSTNILDYGRWNSTVKNTIIDQFNRSLPEKQTMIDYGQYYYYRSKTAMLGDLNFIVYAVLQFEDQKNFEKELIKYDDMLYRGASIKKNDIVYYVIQGSENEALEFLNDKIYDGISYYFEIISINEKQKSISFINAYVWDYISDQVLANCLEEIFI